MKTSRFQHRPRVVFNRSKGFETYEWPLVGKLMRIRISILMGLFVTIPLIIIGLEIGLSVLIGTLTALLCAFSVSRYGFRTVVSRLRDISRFPLVGSYGGVVRCIIVNACLASFLFFLCMVYVANPKELLGFEFLSSLGAFGIIEVSQNANDLKLWNMTEAEAVATMRTMWIITLLGVTPSALYLREVVLEVRLTTSAAWNLFRLGRSERPRFFLKPDLEIRSKRQLMAFDAITLSLSGLACFLVSEYIVSSVQSIDTNGGSRHYFAFPILAGTGLAAAQAGTMLSIFASAARLISAFSRK